MAFKMGVDSLAGGKVIPAGPQDVILKGFKPKFSKDKGSVNFNAQMEVINHPEYDGTKLYEGLNSKAGFIQVEFAHAFGFQMEDQGNGNYTLPGFWDGDEAKFNPQDPTTWVYSGPLIGRTAKVEVAPKTFEGKETNAIRRYYCALPPDECAAQGIKHIDDLLKNQKQS